MSPCSAKGKQALTLAPLAVLLLTIACERKVNESAVNSPGNANAASTAPLNSASPSSRNGSLPNLALNKPGEPPIVPDPKLTPGDALDVTRDDICTPGYAKKVRDVPQAVKEQAYREYGITHRDPGEYEVDHLISLELGGSNSIKNLWPQSYRTEPWNAHVKDRLENKLHEMICSGQIDIKTAQREIATDWITAYKKYVGEEPRAASANERADSGGGGAARSGGSGGGRSANRSYSANATSNQPSAGGSVIGNKKSHVYHLPGCPDYNRVSEANRVEFRSAQEAEAQGYRKAGNCKQ